MQIEKYDIATLRKEHAEGVERNQLHADLLATGGFQPFVGHNSSSRQQMFAGAHLPQTLVIDTPTPRRTQTGVEVEFGKYTYNVRMPCNGKILHIVNRTNSNIGKGSINYNPEQVVIYQDIDTKELGMISLVHYDAHNGYFGFRYISGKDLSMVKVGAEVPKDAILQEVSCINEEGDLMYGREVNIAFMTHPAVAEDAIWVSDEFLEDFKYRTYEVAKISWGNDCFPLNLYGDKDRYQPFPELGDRIREDGLFMAIRKNPRVDNDQALSVDILSPVSSSVSACMTVDYATDKKFYIGGPGQRVVNIDIHHDGRDRTYTAMDEQALKYLHASRAFAEEIVRIYNLYKKQVGVNLQISAPLNKLIVDSLAVLTPDRGAERINRVYKQAPVDRWTMWVTIESVNTPGIGSKFTDTHGGMLA